MRLVAEVKVGGYVARMHGPDVVGQKVRVGESWVYFDFDEQFGPLVVDPRGEPMKRQPVREDHPFWRPFEEWLAGYRKAMGAGEVDAYLEKHNGTVPRAKPERRSKRK